MISVMQVRDPGQIASAQQLMRDFVVWVRDLSPDDAALTDLYFDETEFERELAALPGRYAPAEGALLLAYHEGTAAGCVALRAIDDTTCEMKRMFVSPAFHGKGIGRALAEHVLAEAKAAGYQRMRLDTSRNQHAAIGLYESLGFRRIAPYYPTPDEFDGWLIFFERDL